MQNSDHSLHAEYTEHAGQDTQAYFASRRRGNIFILLALLGFIGFTVTVTIWKWDSQEFMDITHAHEARQQQLEAQREQQRNTAQRLLEDSE